MERNGQPIQLVMTVEAGSLRDMRWSDWEVITAALFTFILAVIIGIRRPGDTLAQIGAWMLSTMAIDMIFTAYGWISFWRHLPIALGLSLWIASISRDVSPAIGVTLAIVFPRALVRGRLLWVFIWLPAVIFAALQTLILARML